MKDLTKLIEIAEKLEQKDLLKLLQDIDSKMKQENCPLVLPLVGEFSSGKTTLINALTDNKQLETAILPTTATIYEIFFGKNKCEALIVKNNGETESVEDISTIRNENMKDVAVVNIFDTSTRVPASTVLVDTPGLSSSDPRHKQALVEFLPNADGVILVADANQQITKSLTDFIKGISLSNRPINLVITKCDSIPAAEKENIKKYISQNTKIPIRNIACVSAVKDDLKEFYALIESISKDKEKILQQVNESRINNIAKILLKRAEELLRNTSTDEDLRNSVTSARNELNRLNRNIDNLLEDVKDGIGNIKEEEKKKFNDCIFDKLELLVLSKSTNYDAETNSIINGCSSMCINEFKTRVQDYLYEKAHERKGGDDEIPLASLESVDTDSVSFSELSYNMDLNELGHEYDGMISTGVKTLAVVAATAYFAPAAGTAAGTAVGAAERAAVSNTAVIVSDALTDAAGAAYLGHKLDKMRNELMSTESNRTVQHSSKASNVNPCGILGFAGEIVDNVVRKITDETMGKPQRRRIIRDYIDIHIMPDFSDCINKAARDLMNIISSSLKKEAEGMINQKTELLQKLETEFENSQESIREYKKNLKQYISYLSGI